MIDRIGYIGHTGMPGPAVAAPEHDAAMDDDETPAEPADDRLDVMQAQFSRDERQRRAEEAAPSMASMAGVQHNGAVSTAGGDAAQRTPAIAGIEPGLLRRLASDGWQNKKVDRRRKRRC